MALQMTDLGSILDAVKLATGLPAYFNDTNAISTQTAFNLSYSGLNWQAPNMQGVLSFDLILCAGGIGEAFLLEIINTEIKIAPFLKQVSSPSPLKFDIDISQFKFIEMFWDEAEAKMEETTTDQGVKYEYKRYFKLNYHFLNKGE
jgi:hypothetical protein